MSLMDPWERLENTQRSREHQKLLLRRYILMKIIDSTAISNRLFSSPVYDRQDSFSEHSTKPLCPESFRELLPEIDTFIFDADGVLWLGEDAISGSPRLIDFLIKNNKQVIILTNNATKSRAGVNVVRPPPSDWNKLEYPKCLSSHLEQQSKKIKD
ncbi:hypothetical protein ANCDUO_15084 [Ancylostoma duodenale]|uniref:Uncharacterized protein n=1 Tax=Ancylostoma duodenale TaxID=51022 RepID=A0A0C2G779_9BILA|nr:hypothetical protein ANCDUO_15084 [Ancylostoma duodenale]